MESSRLKSTHQQVKLDHSASTDPLIQWIGPIDAQWNWLCSNLNIICKSPAVNNHNRLLDASSGNANQFNESLAACPRLEGDRTKVITAVNGRLDPLLDLFIDWQTQWQHRDLSTGLREQKPKRSRKKTTEATIPKGVDPDAPASLKTLNALSTPFSDSFGLILGELWPGHRRTFPLPDWCVPFYWYELFDRILPWVHQTSIPSTGVTADSIPSKSLGNVSQSSRGRTNARIENLLRNASLMVPSLGTLGAPGTLGALQGTNALVIADTATASGLWENLFQSQHVNLVIGHPQSMNFRMNPDWVIIDVASPPRARLRTRSSPHSLDDRDASLSSSGQSGQIDENLACIVAKVHSRYPNALIVVSDAFPTWKSWEIYLQHGADILIPRPFHWYGLLWCLQYWLSRRQQVRINVD